MCLKDQDPIVNLVGGELHQFLRRNLFEVQLDDGRIVVAAMPAHLLKWGRLFVHGERIRVRVRHRPRPRLARIANATIACLTC